MPPWVLALWGQNPAGAIMHRITVLKLLCISSFGNLVLLFASMTCQLVSHTAGFYVE